MTADEVMKYRRAIPFKAFELRLKDGRRFIVNDPLHIGRNEAGSRIIVAAPDDTFESFPPTEVCEVALTRSRRAR